MLPCFCRASSSLFIRPPSHSALASSLVGKMGHQTWLRSCSASYSELTECLVVAQRWGGIVGGWKDRSGARAMMRAERRLGSTATGFGYRYNLSIHGQAQELQRHPWSSGYDVSLTR